MRRVFESTITERHPVLNHHRVHGRAVLPGLAYIDMLLQLACPAFHVAFNELTLRRLSILQPLIANDMGIRLRTMFEPIDGGWSVRVDDVEGRRYATAELLREAAAFDRMLDVVALRAASTRQVDMEEIYAAAAQRRLAHAGIIRAAGTIDVCDHACLIELHAQAGGDGMVCHPAIIDGAAMAAEALRSFDDAALFLPLYYEAFACSERIDRHCYALIDRSTLTSNGDLVRLDISFHAADGRQVAELRGMTSKRVRTDELPPPVARTEADVDAQRSVHAGADASVEATLRALIAPLVDMPAHSIDAEAGFFAIGLQSAQMLDLLVQIERVFDLRLSPTLLFEHGTLAEVAEYLQQRRATVQRAPVVTPVPPAARRRVRIRADDSLVRDHRVYGRPALMGVAHPCFALNAVVDGAGRGALEAVVFSGGPLPLSPPDAVELDAEIDQDRFRVLHEGAVCCSGRIAARAPAPPGIDPQRLLRGARALTDGERDALYAQVRDFAIGPALRVIDAAHVIDDTTIVARIVLDADADALTLPVRLLNACYFLVPAEAAGDGERPLVPLAIERIDSFAPASRAVWVVHTTRTCRRGYAAFDATFYDDTGVAFASVRNASVKDVSDPSQLGRLQLADVETSVDIAIVGLAGRYPRAADLQQFWAVLRDGVDCISEIPAERWNWRDYYSAGAPKPGRISSHWGGFIDDVDMFAPLFFRISPRDAAAMDPQERLFLEHSWLAIEDAGHTRDSLCGTTRPAERRVGVYVGAMSQEYALFAAEASMCATPFGLPTGIASIANRVSFHCDFRGPSVAIDTMCSGSLSAIAFACEALRSGEIDAALAGGVNLSLHPNKYLMLSQGGFIASRGRCASFGVGGDGYVPSEGVGVAVLKRLADAERDNDAIHGVIRGVALNHGGRTSGYTVPNPRAQQDVVARAWRQAAADPGQLDYIEAHGTGTSLGDPIEIEGLARAFADAGLAPGACAIGSVKSNIGHCESAAGIAGLTKVLLQFAHGMRAPSLYAAILNPNIDFARSPFTVQRTLAGWPRRRDERGSELPRLAAVSSFGAGGANAHLIVQEWIAPVRTADVARSRVFPLSARSAKELSARVTQLAAAIDEGRVASAADVAWTLQVGRESMSHRLAVVAATLAELANALHAYLRGESAPALFRGEADAGASARLAFADRDLAGVVGGWARSGQLAEVAQWWTTGGSVDWAVLREADARRAHLPGYPFDRERCWITVPERTIRGAEGPHPLLHANTSTLHAQRYTSTFDTVRAATAGGHVAELVALEMAIAAAAHASDRADGCAVAIDAIEWHGRLHASSPAHAVVEATATPGVVAVRVHSDAKPVLDLRVRIDAERAVAPFDAALVLDWSQIDVACDGVSKAWRRGDVVVARVAVDVGESVSWLAPALSRTLLQVIGAFGVVHDWVPAAIERIVATASRKPGWLRVSRRSGSDIYDVDVHADDGGVCAQLCGLRLVRASQAHDLHVFVERWRPQPLDGVSDGEGQTWLWIVATAGQAERVRSVLSTSAAQIVVLVDSDGAAHAEEYHRARLDDAAAVRAVLAEIVASVGSLAGIVYAADAAEAPTASIVPRALSVLHGVHDAQLPLRRIVLCGRATLPAERSHLESWIGIQRSFHSVLPQTSMACVFTSDEFDASVRHAWAEANSNAAHTASYVEGVRHVLRLEHFDVAPSSLSCLRQRGTYLITGGLGGIGRQLARHLRRAVDARLVLVGRSPLDPARAALLAELADGSDDTVEYLCSDMRCADTLRTRLADLAPRMGPIDGVFHLAGVAGAGVFAQRTAAQHDEVLQPKIAGTLMLDHVLHGEAVDFFCSFASSSAVLGDFGACDYAAGNRFQLAHAATRASTGGAGRSLAVAWPLWAGEGMHLGAERTQAYLAATGQRVLDGDVGFELIERLLLADAVHPLVLAGERASIEMMLSGVDARRQPVSDPVGDGDGGRPSRAALEAQLKTIAGEVLHLAPDRIARDAPLADFGFDSITLQLFANRLAAHWDIAVAPTVFFNWPTIATLAEHFESRVRHVAIPQSPPERAGGTSAPHRRFAAAEGGDVAIAIVGLSGRFPNARSVDALWQMLRDGGDAVGEIPPERFDLSALYSADAEPTSGLTNCKWAGLVPGVAEFDPLFFELAPSDAARIDPRQRLLLQEAYRALEDAAFGEHAFASLRVGVFVGAEAGAYGGLDAERETITANHEAVLAARLSHFLDLRGPNLSINTACSSGLVALHVACNSLRARECDVAVVAAVNLLLVPDAFVGMTRAGMLSADGRCHAFDQRANGMVPGEAVVALVVRRLSDAEAAGDDIRAVVRGIGVNHDGRTNGLTAPNGVAQAELIRDVQQRAGVSADAIGYVVAHGTATPLGDPVEVDALTSAFRAGTTRSGYCALTSTKTNVGHAFAASGLVSVVCLVEALRHGVIPPSLHHAAGSTLIDWHDSPFFVNTTLRAWPVGADGLRFGAVSAFGMSGTNAHAVLQSPPPRVRAKLPRGPMLLVLSAKTAVALSEQREALLAHLRSARPELLDVGCTLLTGRRHYRHRQAWVVADLDDAIAQLAAAVPGRQAVVPREFVPDSKRIAAAEKWLRDAAALQVDAWNALAQAYVDGHALPWHELFAATQARRIALPTYPFARDHYWIDPVRGRSATVETPADSVVAAPGDDAVDEVCRLVAEQLGLPLEHIDPAAPLDEYGFDSIMATALAARVRERVPDAVESLFLEHPTLAAVRDYVRSRTDRRVAVPESQPRPQPAAAGVGTAPAATAERDPVAIVGLAALIGGARSIEDFWCGLVNGDVRTRPLPERRRALMGLAGTTLPREFAGGWLDDVEYFDRERFKIGHAEAVAMDPQLRKLLETVWQTIADAGYTPTDVKRRSTAVFVATSGHSGYAAIDWPQRGTQADDERPALYANRISNLFDLQGPSEVVDTGCASFLVALGRALDALRDGRCEQAIVATAQMQLTPAAFTHPSPNVLYTSGDATRSFERDSDGYVPSEVVGAVLLKRASAADADGDASYCLLRSVGVHHGGKSPLKWYSPNIQGQKRAIADALQQAGIDPVSISYVEAEANGSQLGDASEVAALQAMYGPRTDDSPLLIGSLKPVFGHAESGSTFHAVLKVLLALRYQRLPGVARLGELNPNIKLEPGCRIVVANESWPRRAGGQPRRAAVHSLSLGGVNAHLIVEEAPPKPPVAGDTPGVAHVFVWSDRTVDQLRETVAKYALALAARGDCIDAETLSSIAHTLQRGRVAEKHRLGIVAESLRQLRERLDAWLNGGGHAEGVYCTGGEDGRAEGSGSDPLDEQARAWVRGGTVAWPQVSRRRVHLPPPTLARTLCWHEHLMLQATPAPTQLSPVVLAPRWKAAGEGARGVTASEHRRAVLCGWPEDQAASLCAELGRAGVDARALQMPPDHALPARFTTLSRQVFAAIGAALAAHPSAGELLQIAVPNGLDNVFLVAFAGLLRSAKREHSRFRAQLVVLDHRSDTTEIAAQLADASAWPDEVFLQYIRGRRWTHHLEELQIDPSPRTPLFSAAEPVALISGGGGALGLLMARCLLQHAPALRLYLLGRAPLDDVRSRAIAALPAAAGQVKWLQCDVADREQVDAAVDAIVARHDRLDAVVHSAGALRDALIVNKREQDIDAVLAPKVAGLCHLDEATRNLDLEFMLAFSSVSAVFGNPGQAAYALANAFLDAYAAYRNQLVAFGERRGRTLSVNWPLWRDGGMKLSVDAVDRLMREHGLFPLPGDVGADLAVRLLGCGEAQVAVAYGDAVRIKQELSARR